MITNFIETTDENYEYLNLSGFNYIGSYWQNDSQTMDELLTQEIDLAPEVLRVRVHYPDQWEDAYFIKG